MGLKIQWFMNTNKPLMVEVDLEVSLLLLVTKMQPEAPRNMAKALQMDQTILIEDMAEPAEEKGHSEEAKEVAVIEEMTTERTKDAGTVDLPLILLENALSLEKKTVVKKDSETDQTAWTEKDLKRKDQDMKMQEVAYLPSEFQTRSILNQAK